MIPLNLRRIWSKIADPLSDKMNDETTMFGEITGVIQKTQGEQKYLFGTIRSDQVKNVTFVPVIESSRKTCLNEIVGEGYQRPGSLTRMRAFARFLKENPNSIIPPVLLSGRGKWKFEPACQEQDSGKLIIQERAAILDGQHRLGGFVHLYESEKDVRDVSFILLPDLNLDQETKEFVTVNTNQTGVPKPLTAYLGATEQAQISWELNERPDSPFKERITKTSMQHTHLFNLHSVAREVTRLFAKEPVQNLDIDQKGDLTVEFWTIIADELKDEWSDIEKLDNPEIKGSRRNSFEYKLLELTGLIAWSYTGAEIFSRSYDKETGMNWDNVRRLVKASSAIDWRKNGAYVGRTGMVGGKAMADEMIGLLPAEDVEAEDPEELLRQALS